MSGVERRRSSAAQMRRRLNRRAKLEQDIRPRQATGRNRDGTANLVPVDGECPENGGLDARDGVLYTPSAYGASTLGTSPSSGPITVASGALRIDAHQPRELTRGETVTVTLRGLGFGPSLHVDHIGHSSSPASGLPLLYPGLTAESLNVIDTATAEMVITVGPAAPLGEGDLAYQAVAPAVATEPGTSAALLRLSRAFEVVPPRDYRWVAWFHTGSRLKAVEVAQNGAYGVPVGEVSASGFSVDRSVPIPRSNHLAPDSALWVSGSTLTVAELRTGQVYTRPAQEGRHFAGAVFHQGALHWIEWTPGRRETSAVSRWSCDARPASFTDPDVGLVLGELHATHEVGDGVGEVEWHRAPVVAFAGNSAAGCELEVLDENHNPSRRWAHFPFSGAPSTVSGLGASLAVGMPYTLNAQGSVSGSYFWDGTLGFEGFVGFQPYPNFEAPPVGAVAGDHLITLYDPDTRRLVELSTLNASSPSVDITLEPHPEHGNPVRVVPGR